MNWIVLIGAPAVGKSTLAAQLAPVFNAKVYSFDKEFPLNALKEYSECDSKNCRCQLIEKILSESKDTDWIIVDDTCHLKSMQKRYVLMSETSKKEVKIVFLYISSRNEQISDLHSRNTNRDSDVTNEEIDRMVQSLNQNPPDFNNLIQFNYTEIPPIDDLKTLLHSAFKNYSKRSFGIYERDALSDTNIMNQLNLALNKEISAAFETTFELDGKSVSVAKKTFLTEIRNRKGSIDIESIVKEFREKHLKGKNNTRS